ncbi:nitroreductase [Pseudomonas putida]
MIERNPVDDAQVLERLISERYSCRAYLQDRLPQPVIDRILAAAQRTVSDCNTQPWRMYVISGEPLQALREAVYARAMSGAPVSADIPPIPAYTGVFQERRRTCGWTLYNTLGIQKGDRERSARQAMENFRFFGAPHLALITSDASLGPRGLLDCGGYVTAFLLAAQALGVGAVAQASIAQRADVLREHLAIPGEHHIACGVAFGWPDREHLVNSVRTIRAPLDEVVQFVG